MRTSGPEKYIQCDFSSVEQTTLITNNAIYNLKKLNHWPEWVSSIPPTSNETSKQLYCRKWKEQKF